MSSTEINIGLVGEKNSSRVLKPPGGGSTDLFGATEANDKINVRPNYNQQNSSNMSAIMGVQDANMRGVQSPAKEAAAAQETGQQNGNKAEAATGGRVRQPPGGFSSGLW